MYTLQELGDLVGGSVSGDPQTPITGVSEIQSGQPGTITFLSNPRYKVYLESTTAAAVIVADSTLLKSRAGLVVDNPQLAIALILDKFARRPYWPEGIHPSAIIGENVALGQDVSIGPQAIIESGVRIGTGCRVGAQCFIGQNSVLQKSVTIHPKVMIYHDCEIGGGAVLHSGVVIGSDGYGYIQDKDQHVKIPQNGRVVVGKSVEIGANTVIDRGTISDTVIGDGTKIDNLVHIAHNVKIGKGCLITAQVGIAGSVVVGDFCIFAGHTGVAPHLTIGDRAVFAAKSGVTKSLPGGQIYAGMPAREIRKKNLQDAALANLPDLKKRLQKIEQQLNLSDGNET